MGVRADGLEVAKVFTVHRSENKVEFLSLVGQIAEGCKIVRKVLHWQNTARWEQADWFFIGTNSEDRSVWF